jgi:hypothetical protein
MVHLLTKHHGIVHAIVQGARKPKSPFFSQYELGNTLEVILIKSRAGSLYKIKSSSIVQSTGTTLSYPQLLSVQAALEIYDQCVFTDYESAEIYRLLSTYLDYIHTVRQNHLLVWWRFLIRLTDMLGFPIVYEEKGVYKISDKSTFLLRHDEESVAIVERWLQLLPSVATLVQDKDILKPSCKVVNMFFFDWFAIQLNKKMHFRAIKLYEEEILQKVSN